MRIAIDIDSTLHPYWDQLARAARRRFGVHLAYEDQVTWDIALLRPEQLRACIDETHRDDVVMAARPYPGAVDVVRSWRGAGHFIQISSHRAPRSREATARWLNSIGLPYDELHCSFDKVSRCTEAGIDLLIDDSPVNLMAAAERGIAVATLAHPWNRDICEDEDVIRAADWPGLAERLAPLLGRERTPV